MSKLQTEWNVLRHGELEQLADNLWTVKGDLPHMALRRRMTVARTAAGKLVIHSAIAMDEEHMAELEALGEPAVLVVPNGWHCLDAARYEARYPALQVVCPRKARKMVERKVQSVDGDYGDVPSPCDEGTVRLEHFDADRHMEGAMIVRSDDGVTLVFADSLFNLPHRRGVFWWLYGRLLRSTGGPKVTVIGRAMMALTRSTGSFRRWLERQGARSDVVRLVPGHGEVVRADAAAVLRALARSL